MKKLLGSFFEFPFFSILHSTFHTFTNKRENMAVAFAAGQQWYLVVRLSIVNILVLLHSFPNETVSFIFKENVLSTHRYVSENLRPGSNLVGPF